MSACSEPLALPEIVMILQVYDSMLSLLHRWENKNAIKLIQL